MTTDASLVHEQIAIPPPAMRSQLEAEAADVELPRLVDELGEIPRRLKTGKEGRGGLAVPGEVEGVDAGGELP
jgi:hypothetical protein